MADVEASDDMADVEVSEDMADVEASADVAGPEVGAVVGAAVEPEAVGVALLPHPERARPRVTATTIVRPVRMSRGDIFSHPCDEGADPDDQAQVAGERRNPAADDGSERVAAVTKALSPTRNCQDRSFVG
ncbi:MAG: hypothetical protein WKF57_10815 [Nakamurella sp.]